MSIAKSEPVRLYGALMSGWLVLLGGQAFTDLLPGAVTGLLILGTAAVKVGVDEYTRSQVQPVAKPKRNDGGFADRTLLYALAAIALALCILALLGVQFDLNAR